MEGESPRDRSPDVSRSARLMRGFVLGDDVRRDAPALIYLVAMGPCPLADSRALLAPGTVALAATANLSATRFASVFHILGELITKPTRVAGTQIDLIADAVETKAHGLSCLTTVDVIAQ